MQTGATIIGYVRWSSAHARIVAARVMKAWLTAASDGRGSSARYVDIYRRASAHTRDSIDSQTRLWRSAPSRSDHALAASAMRGGPTPSTTWPFDWRAVAAFGTPFATCGDTTRPAGSVTTATLVGFGSGGPTKGVGTCHGSRQLRPLDSNLLDISATQHGDHLAADQLVAAVKVVGLEGAEVRLQQDICAADLARLFDEHLRDSRGRADDDVVRLAQVAPYVLITCLHRAIQKRIWGGLDQILGFRLAARHEDAPAKRDALGPGGRVFGGSREIRFGQVLQNGHRRPRQRQLVAAPRSLFGGLR